MAKHRGKSNNRVVSLPVLGFEVKQNILWVQSMNKIFDEHADNYSEEIDKTLSKYGVSHDFFMVHKAWLIEKLLNDYGYNPEDINLLDVGCGVGKIHEYQKGKLGKITGIDISKSSIDVARKAHPEVDYQYYDGHRIPFEDATFDLSIAIGVFHHVSPEQWEALAVEMLRVLRLGGLVIVIEHNPYNPVTRRIVNTCPLDEGVVLLRPKKLRGLFSLAQGEDVSTRTILSVPPKTGLLKKIDGVLGIMPFGAQYYMIAKKAH